MLSDEVASMAGFHTINFELLQVPTLFIVGCVCACVCMSGSFMVAYFM